MKSRSWKTFFVRSSIVIGDHVCKPWDIHVGYSEKQCVNEAARLNAENPLYNAKAIRLTITHIEEVVK